MILKTWTLEPVLLRDCLLMDCPAEMGIRGHLVRSPFPAPLQYPRTATPKLSPHHYGSSDPATTNTSASRTSWLKFADYLQAEPNSHTCRCFPRTIGPAPALTSIPPYLSGFSSAFTQQIFTEHVQYAKHYSRSCGYSGKQVDKNSSPHKALVPVGW